MSKPLPKNIAGLPKNDAEAAFAGFVLSLAPDQRERLTLEMRDAERPREVAARWMAEHELSAIRAGKTLNRSAEDETGNDRSAGALDAITGDLTSIANLAQAVRRLSSDPTVRGLAEQIEVLAEEAANDIDVVAEASNHRH